MTSGLTQAKTAAIDRLVKEFGARSLLELETPRHTPLTFKQRLQSSVSVINCTKCSLVDSCSGPVSADFGNMETYKSVAVIGEAPGPDEDKQRRPFVGKSGQLLRGYLKFLDMDPDEIVWMNAVSCFPNNDGRIRPPTYTEHLACRNNLLNQLEAATVGYVLLTGTKAIQSWCSSVKLQQVLGKWFVWNSKWMVYPIWHPSYVLRNKDDLSMRKQWEAWIRQFVNDVRDGGFISLLSHQCIACSEPVYVWGSNGLPWCRKHIAKMIESDKEHLKYWREHNQNQLTMEEM
jgi:DNA polymerase